MTLNKLFFALVKNEFGIDQFNLLQWAFYICAELLPWLMFNYIVFDLGFDGRAFFPGMLMPFSLLWLVSACAFSARAQVPVSWSSFPNFKAFEYLFTRAIDRRLNFRAKAAYILIMMLWPQVLFFCASPFAPAMTLTVNKPEATSLTARKEQFAAAFSIVQHQPVVDAPAQPQIVIPHGMTWYAGWLICLEILLIYFYHAYYAWLGSRLNRSSGWTVMVLIAPVFVLFSLWPLAMYSGFALERGFMVFVQHPIPSILGLVVGVVAIQRYSEWKFSQLEIW